MLDREACEVSLPGPGLELLWLVTRDALDPPLPTIGGDGRVGKVGVPLPVPVPPIKLRAFMGGNPATTDGGRFGSSGTWKSAVEEDITVFQLL